MGRLCDNEVAYSATWFGKKQRSTFSDCEVLEKPLNNFQAFFFVLLKVRMGKNNYLHS